MGFMLLDGHAARFGGDGGGCAAGKRAPARRPRNSARTKADIPSVKRRMFDATACELICFGLPIVDMSTRQNGLMAITP
nr:hypothetical protein WS54_03070 [Burkholderia sp. NRF60-BP8]